MKCGNYVGALRSPLGRFLPPIQDFPASAFCKTKFLKFCSITSAEVPSQIPSLPVSRVFPPVQPRNLSTPALGPASRISHPGPCPKCPPRPPDATPLGPFQPPQPNSHSGPNHATLGESRAQVFEVPRFRDRFGFGSISGGHNSLSTLEFIK